MLEFNEITDNSKTPKYIQLADLIIKEIKNGTLKIGSRLPSINEISEEYYLSRDTVEKALNELRCRGIITSVKRRGYFISSKDFTYQIKIAFITNLITDYKRNIFESFTQEMGDNALVDVYIYNYDITKFEIILLSHINEYDYFLVIPFFKNNQHYQKATDLLNNLPDKKLIILDNYLHGIKPEHSFVSQNFELDIREALISLNDHLSGYKIHYLVYPEDSYHPRQVVKGFEVFCKIFDYSYKVVEQLDADMIHKDGNYVLLSDDYLVDTIEIIRQKKLELGKEVGLISYNENPLKKILAGGITVISTDWQAMGKKSAEIILNQKTGKEKIPFKIYLRNSILK
jgi:DNA-binding transcriptional regulator YhcF (GntR family)